MKKIGIITGSGPEAGVDFWIKLLKRNREYHGNKFRGDLDVPDTYIHSISKLGLSMDLEKYKTEIWHCLIEEIKEISQKCDYFVTTCNTLHYFAPRIKDSKYGSKFISITDSIKKYISQTSYQSYAILGINSVSDLNSDFSPFKTLSQNVSIEILSPADIQTLHNLVNDIKVKGIHSEHTKVLQNLINRSESQCFFLACTELPLLKLTNDGKHIVDVTDLLTQDVIRKVYGLEKRHTSIKQHNSSFIFLNEPIDFNYILTSKHRPMNELLIAHTAASQLVNNTQKLAGLRYIENYISNLEHDKIKYHIDQNPWSCELKRRVQHYGYKYNYKARSINHNMKVSDLPRWAQDVGKRLCTDGYMKYLPDQLIVNEYFPGQGIGNHIDCTPCFEEVIVSISLVSPTTMVFINQKTKEKIPMILSPKSCLILQGDARYKWTHGIPARKTDTINGVKVPRTRRLSLTFRKVKLSSTQIRLSF